MTFGALLQKTREAAENGRTWESAWNAARDEFEALAAVWTPQTRRRNFEAVLAAFVSDDFAAVEPIRAETFSAATDHTSFANADGVLPQLQLT